ncbi:MAG TPA: TIGR00366 family protein [Fimbriimonadales bacterium]|nr:TIGR00366 family protein [Fimbriimonadales bacterium]
MIEALGERMARWSLRWVPDPFILALLLTFLSLILAFFVQGFGILDAIGAWGGRIIHGEVTKDEVGFWRFLAFSMQMCLILVTGHALAATKPVGKLIRWIGSLPKNTAQAASLTSFVSMLFGLINWGLGLIVGALLAREVGLAAKEKGNRIHYPLVVASGYLGLLIWHGGLSGSAPFKMTQTKDVVEMLGAERAASVGTVGLEQTIFSPMNGVVTVGLLVFIPIVFWLLAPKDPDKTQGVEIARIQYTEKREEKRLKTPVEFLERTPLITILICLLGFGYWFYYLSKISLWSIDINAINMFFLFLGLLLHGSPMNYIRAIDEAAQGCGAIILQFPFYAGIQGILQYSGLIKVMSDWIAANSTVHSLPVFTFFSATIVGLFIPSGGAQWGVQGPVVVDSAANLGTPLGPTIMALAYGDEYANMLQPFWALPLLSITGLRARDIIGYTTLVMLLSTPVFVIPLWIFV